MKTAIISAILLATFATQAFSLDLTRAKSSDNIEIAAIETTPKSTKVKKPKQAEMLAAVCASKAVKTTKMQEACSAHATIASLKLPAAVTVKAPSAELKILYSNLQFFN